MENYTIDMDAVIAYVQHVPTFYETVIIAGIVATFGFTLAAIIAGIVARAERKRVERRRSTFQPV